MDKRDIFYYTGDVSQIFYAKQYRFHGGRADGMLAVDVNNGSGIEFTVFVDRAMDIGRFAVGGVNCTYLHNLSSSAHCSHKELDWLDTFNGGMLSTCGLNQVGSPCIDEGEAYGLHGKIGSIPAEEFCCEIDMDKLEICLRGKIFQSRIFAENLVLTREIRVRYGENKVFIKDEVENRGAKEEPYLILYHMNLGYPLLDQDVKLETNATYIKPREPYSQKQMEDRLIFPQVRDSGSEEVYYYDMADNGNGWGYAGIYNEKIQRGVRIWARPDQLKHLAHWKNPYAGDYVLGIEPSNCRVEGRTKQRDYGLEYIRPLETKVQEIEIEALLK